MKVLSTDNLGKLLESMDIHMITKEYMGFLFEKFGESYYKDHGISKWEKTEENGDLKRMLGDQYSRQPDSF